MLETTFIPRRSCGCLPHEEGGPAEWSSLGASLSLEANLIRHRDLILAEMSRSVRGELRGVERDWELRLFRALQDEFRSERPPEEEPFKDALDELLVSCLEAGILSCIAENLPATVPC